MLHGVQGELGECYKSRKYSTLLDTPIHDFVVEVRGLHRFLMGSQKVLVVLSRLGGLSIRQMTHRATDARCDQMRQRLMDQSLHWRSLSTSCPAFLKDEVVDAKSGKDSSSKPPQVEADDETRSILNDIWRDFECLPPKPNPLEGGGGKNPVVPGATKSDTSKEKTSSGPELRNILHSALANAKISYSDEDATVILDSAEEESQRYSMKEDVEYFPENVKVDQFEGLNLTRGENGVFEMEELVEVLRDEKLTDIAVITVPKEMVYTDYLVLATALSPRHARGVSEFLKKLVSVDPFPERCCIVW